MNKFVGIGNLTKDPELATTTSGISVCKFSIAVNRSYKNANGEQETDFLNIVTWRGLADNCSRYLKKGSKVAVCGEVQTRTYEKNGEKRFVTEILANDVEFLTSGNKDAAEPKPTAKEQKKQLSLSDLKPTDDPLPF